MENDLDLELALNNRVFGDTLDAMLVAIAKKLPDRPFSRLKGEVRLTLKPHLDATIVCRQGSAEDMQWAFEQFGPPTDGVPGHSLSWYYGNNNSPEASTLNRVFTSSTMEALAALWLLNEEAVASSQKRQSSGKNK